MVKKFSCVNLQAVLGTFFKFYHYCELNKNIISNSFVVLRNRHSHLKNFKILFRFSGAILCGIDLVLEESD